MTKYQPYFEYSAHGKNVEALFNMLWLMNSNFSDHFRFTPIVVFEAFTIESYVNTLGERHTVIWNEIERLPWRKKISILHKLVDKKPDWGKEPLQFAIEVFEIRDKLAHGKPETVKGKLYDSAEEANNALMRLELQPEWCKKIDKKWVMDSKERLESLLGYLSGLHGPPSREYASPGHGGVIQHDIV